MKTNILFRYLSHIQYGEKVTCKRRSDVKKIKRHQTKKAEKLFLDDEAKLTADLHSS